MIDIQSFNDTSFNIPVRGFLHRPQEDSDRGLVLAHGAGSNSNAPLLVAMAGAFADAGFTVLRCDLPFRQNRSFGPPRPGDAERDRAGLKDAIRAVQKFGCTRMFLGGHSYGGRQATMLCAEERDVASGSSSVFISLASPRASRRSFGCSIFLNCTRRVCLCTGRAILSDR